MKKKSTSCPCLNEFNEFYYSEFQRLSKEAQEKNNRNMALMYKKVVVSIQKYPFPILNSSQATLLEGVGETTSKIFEKLINALKEKISKEGLNPDSSNNYLELAYKLNPNYNERKKTGKRKAQSDTENEIKNNKSNIKIRKNLINIDPYTSVWTTVVCSYILHLQTGEVIFDFNDVLAMCRTLTDELAEIKNIEMSLGLTDFKALKDLNLIDSIDNKGEKIRINDFLIKLAKIEIKKSGIQVENENGILNFSVIEPIVSASANKENKSGYTSNNIKTAYYGYTGTGTSSLKDYSNSNYINFSDSLNVNSHTSNNFSKFEIPSQSLVNLNSNVSVNPFLCSNKIPSKSTYKPVLNENKNFNTFNSQFIIPETINNKMKTTDQLSSSSSSKSKKDPNFGNTKIDKFFFSKKKFPEDGEEDFDSMINNNKNANTNTFQIEENLVINATLGLGSHIQKKFDHFLKTKKDSSIIPSSSVILIVDNREKGPKGEKFSEEIEKLRPDITTEERNLAVGDFMWVYTDPTTEIEFLLDFIIERKTTDDLASSIIDGRYNEQKFRLKNSGIKNVYYIFEGGPCNFYAKGNVSKQGLQTAIFNTLNIHDMNIIKTSSMEDTVNHLIRFHDRIVKNCEMFIAFSCEDNDNSLDKKIPYSQFTLQNAKTKNSTVESIFTRQLRCFDDCGAKSVDMIRNVFKCPSFIFRIIQKIEDLETKENLITTAFYLFENNIKVSEENLLFHANPCNFKKIKKELKSIRKIRKNTNNSILNFYS